MSVTQQSYDKTATTDWTEHDDPRKQGCVLVNSICITHYLNYARYAIIKFGNACQWCSHLDQKEGWLISAGS